MRSCTCGSGSLLVVLLGACVVVAGCGADTDLPAGDAPDDATSLADSARALISEASPGGGSEGPVTIARAPTAFEPATYVFRLDSYQIRKTRSSVSMAMAIASWIAWA